MKPINKISATIITLNEEENIADVIKNVQQVCDDVVVVDSLSSDRTQAIATELGARVFEQKYLGDGAQKAHCEQFCNHDWVLSIDADERLSEALIAEINALTLEEVHLDGYFVKRRSFIGKAEIKQWYPDKVVRLYNRKKCGYTLDGEHGFVQAKSTELLQHDMLHYSFDSYATLVRKADRFAVNLAYVRYNEGKRAKWFDPFLHGFGAMFKGLIAKRGIFGGLDEWHVAFASAYNSYMKYVIMLELQKNEKSE